jgi:AcrR family transcriptional regulator
MIRDERRKSSAEDDIREAAEEIQRETKAAATEVRIELGAAGRDIREAMKEVRAALADVWGPRRSGAEGSTDPGRRMSRAQRKEMTRELLLDAAIEVFADKGYHGASLDDVAEAAGFTKGAVYSNFTRKSDLFRALLERESQRRNAALGSGVETVPLGLLPEFAGEWLKQQTSHQRDWDILTIEFWLAAVRDAEIREQLCEGRDEAFDAFGDIIDRKLEDAGVAPGLSGRELAVIVDALGSGLLMNQYLDPDSEQSVILVRALRKLLAGTPAAAGPADQDEGGPGQPETA